MNKKQKIMLIRILTAAALLAVLHVLPVTGWMRFGLYLIPYLIAGYDILRKALKGIQNRQVFDENFLMAVATVGAIALALYERSGDYTEAIAVMLFYQIGEWFQSYAVGRSRRNISELMDIRPDYANVEQDGKLEQVDPDEVSIGTVIVVQPGEKVPIDGTVVEGASTLNTAALTGESLPREVREGDEIISGCVNMTGLLKIRTTREFGESTVSKILDLVGTPPPASLGRRTSSPGSPGCIPPPCVSPPWPWPSWSLWPGRSFWACPPAGASGSTGPSPSWWPAVPALWSSASLSASLPASAGPATPACW